MTHLAPAGLLVTARLELDLGDAAAASRAHAALAPESAGFLELHVSGARLLLATAPAGVGRTLLTIDDALLCLQAALGATEQSNQDA